jgi:DNA repair protein RadA/Sms
MLLCVLERRGGISTSHHDVFLNVVGGLRIEEPAADLGVVLAVASSVRERPIDPKLAVMGEVGLGGEIRRVARVDSRIQEARRLGFKQVMAPSDGGEEFLKVRSIPEALKALFGG